MATQGGFTESTSDGDGKGRGRNGTLAHRHSGLCIETGQVFVISADDPEDLPSLELLELQWHANPSTPAPGPYSLPRPLAQQLTCGADRLSSVVLCAQRGC